MSRTISRSHASFQTGAWPIVRAYREVEKAEIHHAMAAFGLWKDDDDLSGLEHQILIKRQRFSLIAMRVANETKTL